MSDSLSRLKRAGASTFVSKALFDKLLDSRSADCAQICSLSTREELREVAESSTKVRR